MTGSAAEPGREPADVEAGGPAGAVGPADGTALEDGDGEIGGRPVSAILVEARIGRRLLHVELGLGVVAAFLEDDDARTGGSQARGNDGASRSASDHAHVGPQEEVLLDVRAGDDTSCRHLTAPARR